MEALHRLLCDWGNGYRLEIESAGGAAGAAAAIPPHPFVVAADLESDPDPFASAGIPALVWRNDEDVLFEPLQLREDTEYLIDIEVPYTRGVAATRRSQHPSWPLSPRLAGAFRSDPPKRWRDSDSGVIVTGMLNFGSHVGIVSVSPEEMTPVRFEIVPRKLGYFGDFRALLEGIARELTSLLIEVDSAAGAQFVGDEQAPADPLTRLFHYRALMDSRGLPAAIDSIVARPHARISTEIVEGDFESASDADAELLATHLKVEDLIPGGPLKRLFSGHSPTSLPRRSSTTTFDTPENRYVKALLQEIANDIGQLERQLNIAGRNRSAREAAQWSIQLENWLAHPIWRDVRPMHAVPTNSQVLQRRTGYREMLAADMRLQLGMKLPWTRGVELAGGLDGDLRPIEELYEYWCFFTLRAILREICGMAGAEESPLFRRGAAGLEVHLKRGSKTRTDFVFEDRGERLLVTLFYNRSFPRRESLRKTWTGSYSATFRPDYSILVRCENRELCNTANWVHFDAKYRIDLIDVGALSLKETKENGRQRVALYRRDTLDKMHSYRDGVLGSRGAYVLYPGIGSEEQVFIRFPGAVYPVDEPAYPSVGAFPLRPGADTNQRARVAGFLRSILLTMATKSAYREEVGLR